MKVLGADSMSQEKTQTRRLWFRLVKIINVLCFLSLLEPFFRERPEYVLDISLIVGCITNVIVYKRQPNNRFLSRLIWLYYLFLAGSWLAHELRPR